MKGKKKRVICLNDVEGIPKTLYKNGREKEGPAAFLGQPRTGEPCGPAGKAGHSAVQTREEEACEARAASACTRTAAVFVHWFWTFIFSLQ